LDWFATRRSHSTLPEKPVQRVRVSRCARKDCHVIVERHFAHSVHRLLDENNRPNNLSAEPTHNPHTLSNPKGRRIKFHCLTARLACFATTPSLLGCLLQSEHGSQLIIDDVFRNILLEGRDLCETPSPFLDLRIRNRSIKPRVSGMGILNGGCERYRADGDEAEVRVGLTYPKVIHLSPQVAFIRVTHDDMDLLSLDEVSDTDLFFGHL